MTELVILERKGSIAYLTLNCPTTGNAIDVPLTRAFLDATIAVEEDDQIRCVVVRGNGRMFCVGGDVNQLHTAVDGASVLLKEILRYLHPAIARLASMNKLVITAIHGPCAGAGVGLAVVGDIALAEPAAHFTMAYSKIGLSPDGGATWLLPRLVGLRRAQELLLTNRRVSADEAVEMGLITRVVAEGMLADEVDALAEEFVKSAVGALGRTKRLLLANSDATLVEQLKAESENIVQQGSTPEGKEGIAAFVERRKANFEAPEATHD
ncbi:MAG: enoyl-CoA hydratase/isomerase family protein [Emcibacter sp.]|nr:enoyl-CoA hydratase/isomerase family protein [Emcibacter sp.]